MLNQDLIDSFAHQANIAYRAVYNTFERSALAEGAALTPVRTDCFVVEAKVGRTVEVVGALKVEQLSRRHRANSKSAPVSDRIAVLMASKDIYAFDDALSTGKASYLQEAFVDIGYYKVSRKGWRALLGVRYDFAGRGAREGHPIFHAQMHDGSAGRSLAALPTVPTIQPLPESEVFDQVRLPTANMIGASALLKLSADHLSHDSFKTVLQQMRGQTFFGNWRCNCSTLDDVDSARGLLATGWYAGKA